MKDIIKLAWHRQNYDVHKSINGFFYYLRKFPLVGRYIPDTIYQANDLKTGLYILFSILSIPWQILIKFLWLALYFGVGLFWTNILTNSDTPLALHENSWLLGFLLWWLIIGLDIQCGNAFSSVIPKAERDFMDFFQLPRRTILLEKIWLQPLITAIFYLPAFIVFSLLAQNWWYLPVGFLTPIAMTLLGYSLGRQTFDKQLSTKTQKSLWWIMGLSGFVLAIPIIIFHSFLSPQILPILFILEILLLLGCSFYMKHFPELDAFLLSRMEDSLQSDQRVAQLKTGNQYTRQGLQMKEKLTLDDKKDLFNLSGMAYLNALLFQRYRSILWKQLRTRLICIGLAGIAGIGFAIYTHEFLPEKALIGFMPFAFMIMYACSMGRPIAQMVFVNCDIAMLHYSFYREGRAILAGFRYRFFKATQYNGISALCIFLVCLAFGGFRYSIGTIALLALLLTSLTALFSFHDLFIYYILQPFTKDMEVTNPAYKLLSGALYWVAYLNTQLHITSNLYVLGISLILLLYVGIGYMMLLKRAPQTFRMKQ